MKIEIIDDLHPEDNAMLQALYSRDPGSVTTHLEKVKKVGSGQFFEKYVTGYGHKSIADCGSTTIYFEGVSMLAAKAIQDWPLYSGQESSTRYIDFSKQPIGNPVGSAEGKKIQDRWMAFYTKAQEPVREHIQAKYPIQAAEDPKIYARAVKARTFDVLRAFLPAGATTNVSWHTNLRQAADHLSLMRFHPDPEVSSIARQATDALCQKYPHSFKNQGATQELLDRMAYHELVGRESFLRSEITACKIGYAKLDVPDAVIEARCNYADLLDARPPRTELPKFLLELGLIAVDFWLDFGSFRDLQRHRNGVVRMPLLTDRYGFHPWYLEQLPVELCVEADSLIAQQMRDIDSLTDNCYVRQHYLAMGFLVPCSIFMGLPGLVYTVELRTQKTVHPTLRQVMQNIARQLASRVVGGVKLYADLDLDDWDIRRGKQTIEERS